MKENTDITTEEQACPDSTEALLEKYDRKCRLDDSAAMQAVVCILLAAALFFANFKFPNEVAALLHHTATLSESENELFSNPINGLLKLL